MRRVVCSPADDDGNSCVCIGEVLEELHRMPDNWAHGEMADVPYGLSFMGNAWDVAIPPVEVWRELLRVSRPGAPLLVFGHPRTYHRLACNIEDAGWEIRDCLMWLHGEGFPKSLDMGKAIDKSLGGRRRIVGLKPNVHRGVTAEHRYGFSSPKQPISITAPATTHAKNWDGYGTALKPAWEPILLAMKPKQGTFARNALEWGVGGLNIDRCRIGTHGATRRSHQNEYPRMDNGREDRRCWARTGHSVHRLDAGRWPANVLLDEDAAALVDKQSGVSKSRRGKRRGEGSNIGNGKTMNPFKSRHLAVEGYDDEGGVSRFFYCPKASIEERRNNPHPTVKPLRLCEYLARLILPPEGEEPRRLLVPYAGSGSEMIGALTAGWDYVLGIEIDPKYVTTARRRLAAWNRAR